MSHTILLLQPGPRMDSRTYSDFESVDECLEGISKIFEEQLKRVNPTSPSITYDLSQLFYFIDQLTDISCLVYRKDLKVYTPHAKDWIKENLLNVFRQQAGVTEYIIT